MRRIESNKIEEFIKDLNEEELRYLNRLIVARLKLISQAKSTKEMAKYNIGERVEFQEHGGNLITGRILTCFQATRSGINLRTLSSSSRFSTVFRNSAAFSLDILPENSTFVQNLARISSLDIGLRGSPLAIS